MGRPRKNKIEETIDNNCEKNKFEFLNKDGERNYFKVKWRELIDESFLYINEGYYTRKEKPLPDDVSKAEDDGVIIRLSGLRDLASKHGYKSVNYEPLSLNDDGCVMRCRISWEPTTYNGYRDVVTEGIASVNKENTFGVAFKFKEANASNRAFARAVREYFCISSACEEELDKPDFTKENVTPSIKNARPRNLRSNKVLEKTVAAYLDVDTFLEFREKFIKPRLEALSLSDDILSCENYDDIPNDLCKKLTAEIRKTVKANNIAKGRDGSI